MRYAFLSVKTTAVSNHEEALMVTEPAASGGSEMVDRHFRVITSGSKITVTLKSDAGVEVLADELYAAEHYSVMRVTTVPTGQSPSDAGFERISTDRSHFPDKNDDPELILLEHLNRLAQDGWKIEHVETFNRVTGSRAFWAERCYTLSSMQDPSPDGFR